MKYLEETVVGATVVLGLAFIAVGESDMAFATFGTVLGYVFGRVQKLNGALAEHLSKKQK